MISVSNVSMRYGAKVLFDEVSTAFTPGKRYGLTGPNGAGKSTFMNLLTGELEPQKGTVVRPRKLGVLRQDQFAFDAYRVLDTVIMGNQRLWAAMEERDRIYEKHEITNDDGMKLGELEGIVGEEEGYSAETDAALLLQGLDIPDALSGLYAADHQHRRVRDDLTSSEAAAARRRLGQQRRLVLGGQRGPQARSEQPERLASRRARGRAPGQRGNGLDNGAVPGEDRRGVHLTEPERLGDDCYRKRPGQAGAQVAGARGLHRGHQAAGPGLDEGRHPGPHLRVAEAAGERAAMAGVLGAIEREHARADHPGGREPRVIHGEYRHVAHDAQRQVAAGDQPAAESGQPRHGLALPEPGQHRSEEPTSE